MYKELLMQIGEFKTTEDMIKKFIEKDCHGECTICFYGLNTVRINSLTEITLCNLMKTFYNMLIKECKECTK